MFLGIAAVEAQRLEDVAFAEAVHCDRRRDLLCRLGVVGDDEALGDLELPDEHALLEYGMDENTIFEKLSVI